ncbi:MAG: efflux RND transporter periplasmic adaptor subunit [Candidatus Eiseniibacteriota bacterium]
MRGSNDPIPRFRRDLVVRRIVESGDASYTVHDPVRNSYYRHDPITHDICDLLDGQRGAAEVSAEMEARYPQYTFPVEYVTEVAGDLQRGGFLEETFKMNEIQRARAREARRKFAPESLKNIFNIQFGVIDPTPVFKVVYPMLRILFARWFVIGAVIAFLGACGILWDRRDALVGGLATIFTLENSNWLGLLMLWVILFLIVIAHEFGHGLTCMHFGGQPRRLGFMLFYLMPGMFCDVSDIYFFEKRWHRAAVALAGGYVEILCFTLGTYIWAITPSDLLVHDIAFRVMLFSGMTGLVFNYNPLIKLDGYYVLMSWLDIPDLRERAFTYVGDFFKKHVLRMSVPDPGLTRHERKALLIYGLCAMAYSIFYAVVVLLFLRGILVGNFREAGFVVFAVFFLYMTRKQWAKLWNGARYLAIEKAGFVRRHLALAIGLAVLLVGVVLLPLPHRVKVEARLIPVEQRVVASPVEGTIEEVLVRDGSFVAPGAVLAVVRSEESDARSATQASNAGRREAELRRALSEPWSRADATAGGLTALPVARARWEEARAQNAAGWITAVTPGYVLAPYPQSLRGQHVEVGDSILTIGRLDTLSVVLLASERAIGDLGLGQRADLRLRSDPGRRIHFRIESLDFGPASDAVLGLPAARLVDPDRPAQTYLVRARIPNPDGALRPGMSGVARVAAPPLSLVQRVTRFYARVVRADFWL